MKKKVLVILNRLVIGGQSLDTIPLLYRIADDFDIMVLYGRPEKDELEAGFLIENTGNITFKTIRQFRRSFNPLRDIAVFFSVLKAVRTFKPGVVHTHGVKSGFFGRIAAHLCNVPCIIHTFHGHHFHSYFGKSLSRLLVAFERFMAKLTTRIVAIGPSQKKELSEIYRIAPPEKIVIIQLGIDELLFLRNGESKCAAFRQQYNLSRSTVAVGIVGRIVPIKNYDLFVRVVTGVLKKRQHDVRFFIVGDGIEKKQVQDELSRRSISWSEGSHSLMAPVVFTSWVPEISNALYGLDIVVLTSHNEGTPMSLIEAQFCGKPVVATDVGGVKDTFVDDETGYLVAPNNKDAFVEKLLLLIDNEATRLSMGEKATSFALENFSKTKEVNSFKILYRDCS
ncbi:MAG TPA: glycosyltransferase [Chitinophagaceae bacterium]|nr:glycosyltransferase [Chitinophagaceae bacterium]